MWGGAEDRDYGSIKERPLSVHQDPRSCCLPRRQGETVVEKAGRIRAAVHSVMKQLKIRGHWRHLNLAGKWTLRERNERQACGLGQSLCCPVGHVKECRL